MDEGRIHRPLGERIASRRRFLTGAGGLAAGALLAGGGSRSASAQAAVPDGEITVQFEIRGGVVEQEVTSAIAALTAANPNAKINIAPPAAGDYIQELTIGLMTGQAADVFAVTNLATGQLASLGGVKPLDPYLANWADWAQTPDIVKQNQLFLGQTWGLPYSVDTHFLYYRKDLFQQAGLPDPWQPQSLTDIATAAVAIKQASPDVIPIALFAGANPGNSTAIRGFLPLLYASGGTLRDADGKWIIDSCAVRAALGFYELAYQTQGIVPQTVMESVNVSTAMRDAFIDGKLAMLYDGSWQWDDWEKNIPNASQVVGYPLFPSATGGAPFSVGGFGDTWFINARTGTPDLAWAFIAAIMSKGALININLSDPHIPPRQDAIDDPQFQDGGFLQAMVESLDVCVFNPPDPSYQELIGIIQNATGIIATGETTADEAVKRYSEELTRVLGKENVVSQACP
jgi:multiple sugar transport system substrate-binding protein